MTADPAAVDRFVLDKQALDWAGSIVAQVRPEHLDGPTPCGSWTLRELLGHMIAHNHGFAAGAIGTPRGADLWDRLDFDGEPAEAYDSSAAALTAAFAGPLPERIEVYGYGTLPVPTVLGMHIVDFVVHGWDVARSIGSTQMPAEALSDAAYQIMLRFPKDRPSKAFDAVVPVPADAPVGDQLMGYVGRDPQWTASPIT
jgi:uncharacterized protein (TIGR03086 family)